MVDEMVPFSKYIHKIHPYTGTPMVSLWVNIFFCALLGLIDLASYTALSAIFNVLALLG
jgi:amino acid transporter